MEHTMGDFDLLGLRLIQPELNEFRVKLITDIFHSKNIAKKKAIFEIDQNNDLNSL